MQYGAPQVFRAIREELAKSPKTRILTSSTWANNPLEFSRFFLEKNDQARVTFADIHAFNQRKLGLAGNELFVMTPGEFQIARGNRKFVLGRPERIIFYPDGRPGFSFVRLRYSENADAVFAAEKGARGKLQQDTAAFDGQSVTVRHSLLDMGSLPALFDGRPETLIRGLEANPFVLEIALPRPRTISKVSLTLGAMDLVHLKFRVTPAEGAVRTYESSRRNRPFQPRLEFAFPDGPIRASQLRIEITEANAGEASHIEVRELRLE